MMRPDRFFGFMVVELDLHLQAHRPIIIGQNRLLKPPRFAKCLRPQTVSLIIVDEDMLFAVIFYLPSQMQRNISRVTGDMRITGGICVPLW